MQLFGKNTFRCILTVLAGASLLLGTAACSADEQPLAQQSAHTQKDPGHVAIFTPEDGITISQSVPLNKWNSLVPEIKDALVKEGFQKDNLTSTNSKDLASQSQDVQDYVVKHVTKSDDNEAYADTQSEAAATTLVVAPAAPADESTKLYGDYVSEPISWAEEDAKHPSEEEQQLQDSVFRLVSALKLAQESGMHVVLVSNQLPGFTPDAFVQMSTARQIGEIQATQMVNKLQLDKTSKANPKYVEVMLPFDSASQDDTVFAHEAFAGVWDVLGPFFRSGQLRTPSLTLSSSSTDKDWRNVAFVATKSEQVQQELRKRLQSVDSKDQHIRIDGIVAMNDFVAEGVVKELSALGYTGSAADINPSITIQGIVGNITGKKDIAKKPVPDPTQAPDVTDEKDQDYTEEYNSQWPLVTGYGAYISNLQNIVDGKQWMTGLENRKEYATDIAQLAKLLNAGGNANSLKFMTMAKYLGTDIPVMRLNLVSVSASNLKAALIDPGYITLADANL